MAPSLNCHSWFPSTRKPLRIDALGDFVRVEADYFGELSLRTGRQTSTKLGNKSRPQGQDEGLGEWVNADEQYEQVGALRRSLVKGQP